MAAPKPSPAPCVPSLQLCPVEEKLAHELAGKKKNWLKLSWKCTQKPSNLVITLFLPGRCEYLMKRRGMDLPRLEKQAGTDLSCYLQQTSAATAPCSSPELAHGHPITVCGFLSLPVLICILLLWSSIRETNSSIVGAAGGGLVPLGGRGKSSHGFCLAAGAGSPAALSARALHSEVFAKPS